VLVFSGKFDYTPENRVRLDVLKETLEIRLLQRLREDESGVYSPGVFDNPSKYPEGRYSFIIQFGCAPQNVDKLIASTLDEINKLRTDGPPQENVDKWRAEEKNVFEQGLKTNDFWLNYLNSHLQNNESLALVNDFEKLLDRVDAATVKAAANTYLNDANYIRLVLLPENSKAQ